MVMVARRTTLRQDWKPQMAAQLANLRR